MMTESCTTNTHKKLTIGVAGELENWLIRDWKEKGHNSISTGGQHEARLVLRSPVMDVVNKNSTEPQVEMQLAYLGNHTGLPLHFD
jgi:hypothetical protein